MRRPFSTSVEMINLRNTMLSTCGLSLLVSLNNIVGMEDVVRDSSPGCLSSETQAIKDSSVLMHEDEATIKRSEAEFSPEDSGLRLKKIRNKIESDDGETSMLYLTHPEGSGSRALPTMDTNLPSEVAAMGRLKELMKQSDNWKREFNKLKLAEDSATKFREHLDKISKSISNLFQMKIYELKGKPYSFEAVNNNFSGDLTEVLLGNWKKQWFDFVEDLRETSNLLKGGKDSMERSVSNRWNDLMIAFLNDVQKYKLVDELSLRQFLNGPTRGGLITTYLLNRFPVLDLTAVYLNFDLELSLKRNPDMAELLQLLDDQTWEQIKLDYLLNRLQSLPHPATHFNTHAESFVAAMSESETQTTGELTNSMESLAEDLCHYLLFSFEAGQANRFLTPRELIDYKLAYDMLKFIMHYRKSQLSDGLLTQMKEGLHFKQIRAMEEGLVLLASYTHTMYTRSKEVFYSIRDKRKIESIQELRSLWGSMTKLISRVFGSVSNELHGVKQPIQEIPDEVKEAWSGTSYMTGFDEHDRISETFLTKLVSSNSESDSRPDELPEGQLKVLNSRLGSGVPIFLLSDSGEIDKSIRNCEIQFTRYYHELKVLKENPEQAHPDFIKLIESMHVTGIDMIRKLEKEICYDLQMYGPFVNLKENVAKTFKILHDSKSRLDPSPKRD